MRLHRRGNIIAAGAGKERRTIIGLNISCPLIEFSVTKRNYVTGVKAC